MITLHRLGHPDRPFILNSDLLLTIEACPDTVLTLTTGARIVVEESAERVVGLCLAWKSEIAGGSTRGGRARSSAALSLAVNDLI